MPKFVPRVQRFASLETALEAFGRHYKVAGNTLCRLRDTLVIIPFDVELQERRLLCGLPSHPSDLIVPQYEKRLLGTLKDMGWWEKFSPNGRDLLRKRLSRRGKLATTHGKVANRRKGRPQYSYADLEKGYAFAIAGTLNNNTFPISRSGPAFALLEAALCHALPYTGAGGHEGRAMRIRAMFRRSSDN